MKQLIGVLVCALNFVACFSTILPKNSCEQECSKSKFQGNKLLHDVHCHRGCRLYRIMYMVSDPLVEHNGFIKECTHSCKEGYKNSVDQQSCITGCSIQQMRLSKANEIHGHLSMMDKHTSQGNLDEHIQHLQHHLALFGVMRMTHSIKRLCSWTLISSHNHPKILIVRTEQASGPMLLSQGPVMTAQHELQLGGAKPGLMRDLSMGKKKNDMWWVCVIERTLQPLMAGLLLLSILILLWLCFTSSKEQTTTNAKEMIVPNEVGNIKFHVHSPQCVESSDEKKVPLFKLSSDEV